MWSKPTIEQIKEQIKIDAEIGSYQQDDVRRHDPIVTAAPVPASAE
jgi:hypothetical protein